jgi:hypothetical protein
MSAKVRALRSVDLGFADPDRALRFFTGVWNLTPVGEAAPEDGYLLDEWRS